MFPPIRARGMGALGRIYVDVPGAELRGLYEKRATEIDAAVQRASAPPGQSPHSHFAHAVNESKKTADVLRFMAKHVNEARSYELSQDDVFDLVGPLGFPLELPPMGDEIGDNDAPGEGGEGVVFGHGPPPGPGPRGGRLRRIT